MTTTIKPTLIVSLSSWLLAMAVANADAIKLADGTVLQGELAPPAEVVVKTASGLRRVPFAMLAADVQKVYWAKADVQPPVTAQVSDEEIAALANEVNLEVWEQATTIPSFRDRPEKRGAGGLVVTKAFNAIEENWASVYSPKDAVGQAGDWSAQLAKARQLQGRPIQFLQKRWIETFIKAAVALGERDSNEFAANIRELKRNGLASENARNFFTAK